MKNLWQVFTAILMALASIGLLLGGFMLSLAEGKPIATPTPMPTPTDTQLPTAFPSLPPYTPSADSPTPSATLTPTDTPTLPPPPTNCPPPSGWVPYIVQPGDTLAKITAHYRIGTVEFQQANCLLAAELIPGVIVYVPFVPTQTTEPCGPPHSWIVYYVQPGDTLYRLSAAYGITVAELQRANCMNSSTLLNTGKALYVPPWAPTAPSPTIPGVVLPTGTFTDTPESSTPSDTPELVPTDIPTDTPVPVASDTPVEVSTDTLIPSTP